MQLIDLQSEFETREARRYVLQYTRRYRLFLLVITIPSLSRFRRVVWMFLMEYTREREQLIELQQSRVKANTNRDSLREMICAMVHTQTLAFFYSLLRFLLSSFSSSSCCHHHHLLLLLCWDLRTTLVFLRPEYCVVSPLSNPLVTMIPSLSFPFPSCDHHRSLRPISFLFLYSRFL